MLQKSLLIIISVFLAGCAPMLLAPLTVAAAAAEQKTGKSSISTFMSRVTGNDCDIKRVLKVTYPCTGKNQTYEINQSSNEGYKP
jgi:hypothetical protein